MNPGNDAGLSRRFKSAFQTALAMVITYGLALSFDWPKPMWAAFAVAFISMPTVGETVKKGGQRLRGSLLAAVVALTVVSWFAQDRWWFMLCLSIWISVCTYMMSGSRQVYFWFCAGFVAAIIASNAAGDPAHAFPAAVIRTLETSLGIVVYTLVALFVWPEHGTKETPPPSVGKTAFFPDTDRLASAVRVFITYWVCFLAILYVPAFPGGMSFMAMLTPIAMNLVNMPQVPVSALYKPIAINIVLASLVYMLLMPKLGNFAELAIAIFAITFYMCYRFNEPQQMVGRAMGLGLFVAITAIDNDQAYSFLAAANTGLMFCLMCLALVLTAHLPVSTRPEKMFMWKLRRFVHSAGYLAKNDAPREGLLTNYRWMFHRHEVETLPAKLAVWRAKLTPGMLEGMDAELDEFIEQLKSVQQQLLGTENDLIQNTVESFTRSYAMMDWSGLRESRF